MWVKKNSYRDIFLVGDVFYFANSNVNCIDRWLELGFIDM